MIILTRVAKYPLEDFVLLFVNEPMLAWATCGVLFGLLALAFHTLRRENDFLSYMEVFELMAAMATILSVTAALWYLLAAVFGGQ